MLRSVIFAENRENQGSWSQASGEYREIRRLGGRVAHRCLSYSGISIFFSGFQQGMTEDGAQSC
jgi:hypothetical protein